MTGKYCNIHSHSCYSVRDSVLKIDQYIAKCKANNIVPGLSDHGFMGAAYKFYKECKKQGVENFTIGQEFYYSDDMNEKGGENYHLLIIAKNNVGYKNLCMLSSQAYVGGFYRKPRIDFELLSAYSEGLIVSTACVFGRIQQYLLNNEIDDAFTEINRFKKLFKDDFYLEIHNHGLPDEDIVRDMFRKIGTDLGIKLVAANDSHYLNAEDKEIHNVFKQIAYASSGAGKDDGFPGSGYHVLTYEEMLTKFNAEEISNTLEIANKCHVTFSFEGYMLPKFPIPNEEQDAYEYLRAMCLDGLKKRGFDKDPVYMERFEYELNEIHLANLEDYILIVADYCNWCKANDIPVGPGRGSVGNSILAIVSGISDVDSVKYDLMFARFTNKGRILQYAFFDE